MSISNKTLQQTIADRLGISTLNKMQQSTAALAVPVRLLLLAPTGSGKTLAFAIPLIKAVAASKARSGVKGVVIAPTRELALQINDVVRAIAVGMKTVVLYGGHNMADEQKSLSVTPDIIIATPGRLLDHINRSGLDLSGVSALVLDEYDKSLELGFTREMKKIAATMKRLQTVILTSATDLSEIPAFINTDNLMTLDFRPDDGRKAASTVDIARVESPAADKLDTLGLLLGDIASEPDRRTIIFVNHRESAERLFRSLSKAGFNVGLYHGGLEQKDRDKALILFNNGSTQILVSTDLASRGLDIADVAAVVHYHLPPTPENWTHRNGRTGRMGASGSVYVITSPVDNIPEYVSWKHDYIPSGEGTVAPATRRTLHFNAGKKEKISRGDIAGFLIHKGGLAPDEVGTIDVRDHFAFVTVPADKAREVIKNLAEHKIKNTRVRVTQVL